MQFMIFCQDKPGHGEVRAANRNAHLAYLEGFAKNVVIAGPLLTEDGTAMIGSLLLMEFADRKAAEAFSASDPYRKAGLFQSVTIMPWRKVLPK
jgi:uncharacterized protein YciI